MSTILELQPTNTFLGAPAVTLATECQDCLVGLLCQDGHPEAIVVDAAEARAVRLLAKAGLLGDVQHHVHRAS